MPKLVQKYQSMKYSAYKTLWIICLFYGLVGCASMYDPIDVAHTKYTTPVNIDNNFDISGRFFVKNIINNKPTSQYGNFNWSYENNTNNKTIETITFNTPIGQTVAKIIITNNNPVLYINKTSYKGDDLNLLMTQNLGFNIPITQLHYWLQGVPIPNIQIDKHTTYGFYQLNWNVEYLDWHDVAHPKIIKITNQDITIKLVLLY